jgi:8-oxo-dGTP pyrophosphatase MutT (NUDIX family)
MDRLALRIASRWVEAKKPNYSAGNLYYCAEDDTVFLTKRSGMMHHPHLWDIPGGRADKEDQDIEATANREAKEELDKLPTEAAKIGEHTEKFEKDGKPYEYHIFLYVISEEEKYRWTPVIELNEETEGYNWFKVDELPRSPRTHFDFTWIRGTTDKIKEKGREVTKLASFRTRLGLEVMSPRVEAKYLVPVDTMLSVKTALMPILLPDPHGPAYSIQSIYLDNAHLDLFRASQANTADHFKLRARTYNRKGEVFLEVKRKTNGICSKERNVVPADQYNTVLRTATAKDHIPFVKLAIENRTKPVVLIDYDREAYNIQHSLGRITFDRNVKYGRHTSFQFDGGSDHFLVSPGLSIIEMKFSREIPSLVQETLRKYNLQRISVSKYCRSISAMLQDHELSIPS